MQSVVRFARRTCVTCKNDEKCSSVDVTRCANVTCFIPMRSHFSIRFEEMNCSSSTSFRSISKWNSEFSIFRDLILSLAVVSVSFIIELVYVVDWNLAIFTIAFYSRSAIGTRKLHFISFFFCFFCCVLSFSSLLPSPLVSFSLATHRCYR